MGIRRILGAGNLSLAEVGACDRQQICARGPSVVAISASKDLRHSDWGRPESAMRDWPGNADPARSANQNHRVHQDRRRLHDRAPQHDRRRLNSGERQDRGSCLYFVSRLHSRARRHRRRRDDRRQFACYLQCSCRPHRDRRSGQESCRRPKTGASATATCRCKRTSIRRRPRGEARSARRRLPRREPVDAALQTFLFRK